MQSLEVSGAVRLIYKSLDVKGLTGYFVLPFSSPQVTFKTKRRLLPTISSRMLIVPYIIQLYQS